MPSNEPVNITLRRRKIVRWLIRATLLVLALLLLWQGVLFYGRQRHRDWAKRGRIAFDRGDYRTASLWIARLLQTNANSVGMSRLMADMAEVANSPEAIFWRIRAVQLDPGNPDNFLAWAKTALRLRDLDLADRALKLVPAAARESAAFHSLRAAWAMNSGHVSQAEFHFAASARLEPATPIHALNLATVRLGSPDPETAAKARADLDRFGQDPELQLASWRALITDALNRDDLSRAGQLAEKVASDTRAQSTDQLTLLDVSWRAKSSDFRDSLREQQGHVAQQPERVAALVYWMIDHKLAQEAIKWLDQLPEETTAPQRVAVARADALMSVKQWKELRDFVAHRNWGGLDFVRKAMLTRALRETDPAASTDLWRDLEKSLAGNPGESLMLGQLVAHWGWQSEAESLFWRVAAAKSGLRSAALENLNRICQSTGNTLGLRRVAEEQLQDDPQNIAAKHNRALLSLLVGIDVAQSQETLSQLYDRNPRNPVFASSHALGLHIEGKDAGAIAALQKLPPDQLREPGIALYFGLALAAANQAEKAAPFLDLASRAPLLPEERALLDQARRRN